MLPQSSLSRKLPGLPTAASWHRRELNLSAKCRPSPFRPASHSKVGSTLKPAGQSMGGGWPALGFRPDLRSFLAGADELRSLLTPRRGTRSRPTADGARIRNSTEGSQGVLYGSPNSCAYTSTDVWQKHRPCNRTSWTSTPNENKTPAYRAGESC